MTENPLFLIGVQSELTAGSQKPFFKTLNTQDHPRKTSKADISRKVTAIMYKLNQLSAKQVRITMSWNDPGKTFPHNSRTNIYICIYIKV